MSRERTSEIEKEASEWLFYRDSGRWTEADQARFDEWLNASTLNRVAYLRLELAWADADRLKALGAGIRSDQPPPPGQWTLTPFFERESAGSPSTYSTDVKERYGIRLLRSLAAGILLAVFAWGTYHFWPSGHAYGTPIGAIATVPMTDGSKITLNTDSQVRVALTNTARYVELKQGEAFFDVAKDFKRPFIVNAGGKRIIAVGTQFSVRRNVDDIEVIVTEGKVRIEGSGETLLTPGAIAHAGEGGVLVQRKSIPEVEEQLSWRAGLLMFRDRSLADAITEFNRYNARKIVIDDPAIAAMKIEGNFRATNIEAFVRLLENGFSIRATEEPDRIVLTSK
jgi:transmembrane sensor